MSGITRLDFVQLPQGALVNKILEDHARGVTIVVATGVVPSLDEALNWCESTGWTVRRWTGGARAWWGGLRPVRSAGQIKKKREELLRYPVPGLQVNALDLAYDL